MRALDIDVVVDSPNVGAHLHDHPKVSLRWEGRGPLPPSTVSAGLFTWSTRGPLPSPPDVQFYVGRGIDTPDPFITLTVAVSDPQSRGSIALRSVDPSAAPRIREPEDVARLFDEEIPHISEQWEKIRVLLYLHGGLNTEQYVAQRIVSYKQVMLANQIYPLHIMWESGLRESIGGMLGDLFTDTDMED